MVKSELQDRARDFREALEALSAGCADAARLLEWLRPLFDQIDNGSVVSGRYEFLLALGKDSDFYEKHPAVFHAESRFVSALEGWEGKEWFKMIK